MRHIIFLFLFIIILNCKKETIQKTASAPDENLKSINGTLKTIKDTTVFINSSQGEELKLIINKITKDSIIESEVLGETGKSFYAFTFNKKLLKGECDIYRYVEPIYINSNPKIKSHTKENLNSSFKTKKRLVNIFKSYYKIFVNIKSVLNLFNFSEN